MAEMTEARREEMWQCLANAAPPEHIAGNDEAEETYIKEWVADALAALDASEQRVRELEGEIETLKGENEELAAWKAREQSAFLGMAADLLDAGYKGDGIPDGIKWLKGENERLRIEVSRLETAFETEDI